MSAATPKDVLACQVAILKSGAGLIKDVAKTLDRCAQARLKCFKAGSKNDCAAKAEAACRTKTALALSREGPDFEARVAKACAPLSFAEVLAESGLDFLRQESECRTRFGTEFETRADAIRCARRHYERTAQLLFGSELPRARELLQTRAGLPAELIDFLPDAGGIDADLAPLALDCAKALTKQGQTFAKAASGKAGQCLQDLLKCAQLKPGDAACRSKAVGRCAKHVAAIATARAKAAAAITAGKCNLTPFDQLRSPSSLNLLALGCECDLAGVTAVSGLDDHAQCLVRAHECRLADALRATVPRADALLEDVDLELGDVLCPPLPGLSRTQGRLAFGALTKIFSRPGGPLSGRSPRSSSRGNSFFRGVAGGRRPTPSSKGRFGPITKNPRAGRSAGRAADQQSVLISIQGLNGELADGFFEVPTPPCTTTECAVTPIALDYTRDFGSCPLEPVFALKSTTNGVTEVSPYTPVPQVPEPLFAGEGTGTLVMPFDATGSRSTQLIIHRIGDHAGDVLQNVTAPIAAHVVFWADDGFSFDAFACLGPNGSEVIDPRNLANLWIDGQPPGSAFASVDGRRGMVVVTAYEGVPASGVCQPINSSLPLEALLTGRWLISDADSGASFGNDAIGTSETQLLFADLEGGIFLNSFSPSDLFQSQVIVLGVEERVTPGFGLEIAPIRRRGSNPNSACCSVRYHDRFGDQTSLPDFCFDTAGFAPLADPFATEVDEPLIPDLVTIDASGQLVLDDCVSFQENGSPIPVDEAGPLRQFVFAFNGQNVGIPQISNAVRGKYQFGFSLERDQPPYKPTRVLVMPFDARNGFSTQIVSTVVPFRARTILTHWTYWSEAGTLLAEVNACLNPVDTVVMDATALQNVNVFDVRYGEPVSLAGERGIVIVTALEPDLGPSGNECNLLPFDITDALIGNWTSYDLATNASVGGEAVGFNSLGELDLPGRSVFTVDPRTLTNSEVVTIALEYPAGPPSNYYEVGPVPRTSAALAGQRMCCQVDFVGENSDDGVPLPSVCFGAAGFHPLTSDVARPGDVPLIPPSVAVTTGGYVRFRNCLTVVNDAGTIRPVSADGFQAFFALHNFNAVPAQ